MKMTDEFISTNDLDWYAAFYNGNLAHFASGGTRAVPKKVADSVENYEELCDYFFELEKRSDIEIIEDNLPEFPDQLKREQYLKSYVDSALKGLFSYDVNYEDNSYFLVVKPLSPLSLKDLPKNIKEIIYTLPKEVKSASVSITELE
ncbi:hypothetical protein ACGH6R_09180 [Gilliamella sp. CG13]|uniref:hypothetical protein n=1 Tax=unclassified Gilliamella TaxID=2685620 RepID=UPI00226A9F80|nr:MULTISPECIES: hypothetical protein [unclassified Gilliamella]MCX8574972.1 hypothetical protein [Gilliamella sp. B3831]MCX8577354.1 hypothetical protein [Gilliamella sp. B3815]MCX8590070.1 hypothetical protein [Gilliamella sp. B3812]MCX8604304.1 hypothetical protein [Gilliamella sp. B3823]MCX8606414.1 hypothetical protein [Gilliamella sp. B3825]